MGIKGEKRKMTEEQIKQRAKKHADAYATPDLDDSFRTDIYEANKDGYIAGATEATKELEARIEKMKCCENCNNFMHRIDHRCNTKCKNLSEWEIKEND